MILAGVRVNVGGLEFETRGAWFLGIFCHCLMKPHVTFWSSFQAFKLLCVRIMQGQWHNWLRNVVFVAASI